MNQPFQRPKAALLGTFRSPPPDSLAISGGGRSKVHNGRFTTGSKRLSQLQLGAIFLVWTAIGLFESVPEMLLAAPWPVFLDKIFDSWMWALLTPALMLIDRRLAARQTSGARLLLVYVLLSAPFSLVHMFITGVILYPFNEVWWSPLRDHDYIIFYFLGGWSKYAALVGVLQALRYYNRYLTGRLHLERVERSLLQSRLEALRLHLEPHFLFNALNSISSEVEQDPKLAREMISDLGTLLRQSLDCQDRALIPLSRELALLDHYLSIQKIRFGDRMDVKLEIEPDTLSAEVPSMLLQPLIENAIRHGIEKKRSGGRIVVSASKTASELQLSVADNGPGLPRNWALESSTGHGLRVTLERLAAIYPELANECFSIGRRPRGGTQVIVRIPLRASGQDGPNA